MDVCMLTFKEFLVEKTGSIKGLGRLVSQGPHIGDTEYIEKHIKADTLTRGQLANPELREKHKHTIALDTTSIRGLNDSSIKEKFKAGDNVNIIDHGVNSQGFLHVKVRHEAENGRVKIGWINANRLHKHIKFMNKGVGYERDFVQRLNDHGLMKGEGAGTKIGTDFHLINKLKGSNHSGVVKGELKKDRTADYGQMTIRYDKEKGWHIPKENFTARSQFAEHLNNRETGPKINGQHFLDYLNEHAKKNGIEASPKELNTEKGSESLEFLHNTLAHNTDIVHIGGHGTYHLGTHDRTGLGLNRLSGSGHFRIRQKGGPNTRTVAFKVDHVNQSNFNLDKDQDIETAKRVLGHTFP